MSKFGTILNQNSIVAVFSTFYTFFSKHHFSYMIVYVKQEHLQWKDYHTVVMGIWTGDLNYNCNISGSNQDIIENEAPFYSGGFFALNHCIYFCIFVITVAFRSKQKTFFKKCCIFSKYYNIWHCKYWHNNDKKLDLTYLF